MKKKGYAKFWWANKVHYGKCGSGVCEDRRFCPRDDLQAFYLCEDERTCWTIQNYSDELNEPDVGFFMNLTYLLSLVCLMKSFTLPDFAKHEVGHK